MKKFFSKINSRSFFLFLILLIILIGVVIRVFVYMDARPMWHDECSLALSILDRAIFDYFRPLEHYQCAPPLFMIASNIIAKIFAVNEYSLRLIPLLCGLAALPAFYILSKKLFTNNLVIVLVNLLFAINYQLVYYSQEFKQYSSDVLVCILAVYFLVNINLDKLNTKSLILKSLIIAVLPLVSFPSMFVIFSFFTIQIFNKLNLKRIFLLALPLFIVSIVYYFTTARTSLTTQLDMGIYMWNFGFLKHDFSNLLGILKINLDFFFKPNGFTLIGMLVFLAGFIYACWVNNSYRFLSLMLIISISASFFHVYPVFERTALYLLPVVLILMFLPLDKLKEKYGYKSLIYGVIILVYFSGYISNYPKVFFDKSSFRTENPKTLMKIVQDNYKDSEIFAYNDASFSETKFYSYYFNFAPARNVKITAVENDKEKYFEILNQLPKGYTYWFYYPFEFNKTPVTGFLKEWLSDKTVLYEYHENNSYVFKVRL